MVSGMIFQEGGMHSSISSQNWQHSSLRHSYPSPLCTRKLPFIIDAQGNTLYIAVVMDQMLFPEETELELKEEGERVLCGLSR